MSAVDILAWLGLLAAGIYLARESPALGVMAAVVAMAFVARRLGLAWDARRKASELARSPRRSATTARAAPAARHRRGSPLAHWTATLPPPVTSFEHGHPRVLAFSSAGCASISGCFVVLWVGAALATVTLTLIGESPVVGFVASLAVPIAAIATAIAIARALHEPYREWWIYDDECAIVEKTGVIWLSYDAVRGVRFAGSMLELSLPVRGQPIRSRVLRFPTAPGAQWLVQRVSRRVAAHIGEQVRHPGSRWPIEPTRLRWRAAVVAIILACCAWLLLVLVGALIERESVFDGAVRHLRRHAPQRVFALEVAIVTAAAVALGLLAERERAHRLRVELTDAGIRRPGGTRVLPWESIRVESRDSFRFRIRATSGEWLDVDRSAWNAALLPRICALMADRTEDESREAEAGEA